MSRRSTAVDAVISKSDLDQLKEWVDAKTSPIPDSIRASLQRLLLIYIFLLEQTRRSKALLARLREAMGIIPTSEKSKPLTTKEADMARLIQLKSQIFGLNRTIKKYEIALDIRKPNKKRKKNNPQSVSSDVSPVEMNLDLTPPDEELFSEGFFHKVMETEEMTVDRKTKFSDKKGLHVVHGERKRFEINAQVNEITYSVETVTDPQTGESVTASMSHIGPENFQVTWKGLVNLVMLVVVYAIPLNRVALMLKACHYFTSDRIARLLLFVGKTLEPIYTYLGESLADCAILSGDDTPTKVLEIEKALKEKKINQPVRSKLVEKLGHYFGRISLTKNLKRPQKRYNVSLLSGQTRPNDHRSYIYFFHAHLGHLGNMLTKILRSRSPKLKELVIQSDLSSSNRPGLEVIERFSCQFAGCLAHCRRPFYRYRSDEPELCYYMLRGFVMLSRVENLIHEQGRNYSTVIHYRQKFSKKIWRALYHRAQQFLNPDADGKYWPHHSDLIAACEYLINHYHELTLYLEDPRLEQTNNMRERLLRWDKIMLDSSKFRKSEEGRACIDILRTIIHTASAAEVNICNYLLHVFINHKDIAQNPHNYTPYAYALQIEKS